MNMKYMVLAFGLTMGMAQAEAIKIKVVATDFDKVLTIPSKFKQASYALKTLGFRTGSRCLMAYATSSDFRAAVKAAMETNLKYADGSPVIGFDAYVNEIFKHTPFVSEATKKALAQTELLFKPNVALIEYYQQLQKQGILVYVWTDNDIDSYNRKLKALNDWLFEMSRPEFTPDGFYCAELNTKVRGYSKAHPEYFQKAYDKLLKDSRVDRTNGGVLFVDDKQENINSALKAAKDYTLNLDAVLYDSRKTKLNVVEDKVGIQKVIASVA